MRKLPKWKIIVILLLISPSLQNTSQASNFTQPLNNLKTSSERWQLFARSADKLIGLSEKDLIRFFGKTACKPGLIKDVRIYNWILESQEDAKNRAILTDRIDLNVSVKKGRVLNYSIVSLTTFH